MSVEDFFGSLTNVSFHCLAFANTLTFVGFNISDKTEVKKNIQDFISWFVLLKMF